MSAWPRAARASLALGGALIAALLVARADAIADDDATGAPLMPERDPATLTIGSPASAHRLVIWSDYECAACALLERASGDALRELTAHGALLVEIRHFPLTGHRRAPRAAAAAICAARQSHGWEMHEALLRSAPIWSSGSPSAPWFAHLADSLGLDRAALLDCADDAEIAGLLAGDVALGRTLGLTAVPAVFLDGRLVRYRTPGALVRRVRAVVGDAGTPR